MAASMRCKLGFIWRPRLNSSNRHIQTCAWLQQSLIKSKTFRKIMKKENGKRASKWFSPIENDQNSLFGGKEKKPKKRYTQGMQRRAVYLSDVLTSDITQIVGCGEIGVTASVTQVKVFPDFSHMNIYWECSGDREKDTEKQIALEEKAKVLRHSLIQSQAIGNVPRPVFVKDFSVARQRQVETILQRLSLENNEETDDSETECNAKSDKDILKHSEYKKHGPSEECITVAADDKGVELHIDGEDTKQTDFRQDLYGLQHDVLMKKVLLSKKAAIQRPVIVSNTETGIDNVKVFDLKTNAKLQKNKKLISKKKLLRRLAVNDYYNTADVMDDSSNVDFEVEIGTGDDEEVLYEDDLAEDEYTDRVSQEKGR